MDASSISLPAQHERTSSDGERSGIAQGRKVAPKPTVTKGKRALIDPETPEREQTAAEREFIVAMNEYKRRTGRMFPTWAEVLEVLTEPRL